MNFNLPWCSSENYWLCFEGAEKKHLQLIEKNISKTKSIYIDEECLAVDCKGGWIDIWKNAIKGLPAKGIRAVVVPNDGNEPDYDDISPSFESLKTIATIVENYWLADALSKNSFICYFQPIVDRNNKPFGYESFARAKIGEDIKGGWEIIEASYQLKIHHILDKYLHGLAIEKFTESKLSGSLFINFMTGFIQLPERYLQSISDAIEGNDFIPKRLVLDVSKADHVEDINQISSIIDFCNSKGYSVALDDVKSDEQLKDILALTTPEFVKIDRGLISNIDKPVIHKRIENLIKIAHKKKCTVLAEGIEDKETFNILHKMGADLFQGYYFAKPSSVEEIQKNFKSGKKTS